MILNLFLYCCVLFCFQAVNVLGIFLPEVHCELFHFDLSVEKKNEYILYKAEGGK